MGMMMDTHMAADRTKSLISKGHVFSISLYDIRFRQPFPQPISIKFFTFRLTRIFEVIR